MSKHTPGPWQSAGCAVAEANSDYICDLVSGCCAYNNRSPDEVEANARLIAAAPELLEALKEMCATNFYPVSPVNQHGQKDPRAEAFDKARAAIAKAEGQD